MPATCPTRIAAPRDGFTLIEALVAMSIVALASVALSMGMMSAIQNTDESLDQTIAQGIARQVADEVLGTRYAGAGSGAYQSPLCPNSYEMGGNGRERYDDTDDYVDINVMPPQDVFGYTLGEDDGQGGRRNVNFYAPSSWMSKWRERIQVYYVSDIDPTVRLTGSQTSNSRCVEVQIYETKNGVATRSIAKVRRVYSYVPSP